jgi:large subunit ribosomal protein L18
MKKRAKILRKNRVRAKVKLNVFRPRLSVYRSNKFIYAQIIDDNKKVTLLGLSEKHLPLVKQTKRIEKSKELGLLIAKKAIEKEVLNSKWIEILTGLYTKNHLTGLKKK